MKKIYLFSLTVFFLFSIIIFSPTSVISQFTGYNIDKSDASWTNKEKISSDTSDKYCKSDTCKGACVIKAITKFSDTALFEFCRDKVSKWDCYRIFSDDETVFEASWYNNDGCDPSDDLF